MTAKMRQYMRGATMWLLVVLLCALVVWAVQQAVIQEIEVKGTATIEEQEVIRSALYQHYYGSRMLVSTNDIARVIRQVAPNVSAFEIHKEWFAHTLLVDVQHTVATLPADYKLDVCEGYQSYHNYGVELLNLLYVYKLPLTSYRVDCIGTVSATSRDITIQLGYVTDDIALNLILLQHVLNRFQRKLAEIRAIDMRYDHGVAIRWAQPERHSLLEKL